jgi:hypothetical protein
MQVSHLQEAVRQNESVSYDLEAGSAVCPPESGRLATSTKFVSTLPPRTTSSKLGSMFMQPSGNMVGCLISSKTEGSESAQIA